MVSNLDNLYSSVHNTYEFILKQLSGIDEFQNDDIKALLNKFYGSEGNKISNMCATLLNSIFTGNSKVFVISKRHFDNLMTKDPLHDWNIMQGKDYKLMLKCLYNSHILTNIYPPSGRAPGLYKVVDDDIIKLLCTKQSSEYFDDQEKQIIKTYKEYWIDKKIKPPEDPIVDISNWTEDDWNKADTSKLTFEQLMQNPKTQKIRQNIKRSKKRLS